MNEDETRRTAWKVLGDVEEMMSGAGVAVLAPGAEAGGRLRAFFEDREYQQLEDAITAILRSEYASAQVTAFRGDENG